MPRILIQALGAAAAVLVCGLAAAQAGSSSAVAESAPLRAGVKEERERSST